MRLPPRNSPGMHINMTPMIDVTFQLIIFFLLSSHLSRQESQLALNLPSAASGQHAAADDRPRLNVNVAPDGSVMLGSTPTPSAEMSDRLKIERQRFGSDLEVRIRADRTVLYRTVTPILLACADAGIWNVTFAVVERVEGRESRVESQQQ